MSHVTTFWAPLLAPQLGQTGHRGLSTRPPRGPRYATSPKKLRFAPFFEHQFSLCLCTPNILDPCHFCTRDGTLGGRMPILGEKKHIFSKVFRADGQVAVGTWCRKFCHAWRLSRLNVRSKKIEKRVARSGVAPQGPADY